MNKILGNHYVSWNNIFNDQILWGLKIFDFLIWKLYFCLRMIAVDFTKALATQNKMKIVPLLPNALGSCEFVRKHQLSLLIHSLIRWFYTHFFLYLLQFYGWRYFMRGLHSPDSVGSPYFPHIAFCKLQVRCGLFSIAKKLLWHPAVLFSGPPNPEACRIGRD